MPLRPWAAVVAAALTTAACHGGGSEGQVHPTMVPPRLDGVADGGVDGGRVFHAASRAALPALRVVLDDGRLLPVRDAEAKRDDGAAYGAFLDARARATLAPSDACPWDFVEGRLALAAGKGAEAAAAFDRAGGGPSAAGTGGAPCALAPYATLRATQAYLRAGNGEEAVARAKAIPDAVLLREEARLALADALALHGERAAAVAEWRAYLLAQPRGLRWTEVALRLALALLEGGPEDPEVADEALALATRVVVEAPKGTDGASAELVRRRAFAVVKKKDGKRTLALAPAEVLRQAQAWLDAGDGDRALATAAPLGGRGAPLDADLACKVATLRAQARGKGKGAADAWALAIVACPESDALPLALYAGARASAREKRPAEARARFARLEQAFPQHRLADDARFHQALLALDEGDEAGFEALMRSIPEAYPSGDMGPEALFRVALLAMTKGEWAKAKEPLARILALTPADRHWATAGRAAYFTARVLAKTGDLAAARDGWARVVETYPLAFYMTQAYARLAETDVGAARRALEDAMARDDGADPFLDGGAPELHTAAFDRARALLEVGEIEAGRKELAAAGLTADGAPSDLVWLAAHFLEQAGHPELSHAVSLRRLTDHLPHYPVGRWRVPWEIAYPRAFDPVVVAESARAGLSPAVVWAIAREESGFYPEARSPSNAIGVMQLIVPTARLVARGTGQGWDEAALKRPEVNIALGARLLAQLRAALPAHPGLAIAAYNAGAGAVGRWLAARGALDFDLFVENIPYEETRGYVKRVLASEAAYGYLHARPAFDEVLALPTRVVRGGAAPVLAGVP